MVTTGQVANLDFLLHHEGTMGLTGYMLQETNDDNIISSDGMPFRASRIIPRDFAAQYRIKSRAKHGKYWARKRLHRLKWRYARRRLYWLHRDLIVNLDNALNKNDSLAPSLLTYKICCTKFTMINLAAWNRLRLFLLIKVLHIMFISSFWKSFNLLLV